MKTKIILITSSLFLLGLSNCMGQTSVNASGGEASGSGESSASYTVGETIYTDPTGSGSSSSSQGVQQTYEISTLINELSTVDLLLNLFPNPASENVTLAIDEADVTDFKYRMYDLDGKLLMENQVSSDKTLIPIASYADGTYLLEVVQLSRTVKSFTIIKNR